MSAVHTAKSVKAMDSEQFGALLDSLSRSDFEGMICYLFGSAPEVVAAALNSRRIPVGAVRDAGPAVTP